MSSLACDMTLSRAHHPRLLADPLSIKEQWGVPGPIDAALVWSGRVYLFRGGKYWRLNDACDAPDAGCE